MDLKLEGVGGTSSSELVEEELSEDEDSLESCLCFLCFFLCLDLYVGYWGVVEYSVLVGWNG